MGTKARQSQEPSVGTGSLSRDTILDVLGNQRRRYVVHVLKRRNGDPVSIRELSEQVASWEQDTPIDQLTYEERNRVQTTLHQFHLPKMAEEGFVDYDTQAGTVTLTTEAADQEFYVDVLPNRNIPWGLYHLTISGIAVLCLVGTWFALFPFTLLSPFTWFVFVATMFLVSSIGHFYDNYYRMRLGAREKPPEAE